MFSSIFLRELPFWLVAFQVNSQLFIQHISLARLARIYHSIKEIKINMLIYRLKTYEDGMIKIGGG